MFPVLRTRFGIPGIVSVIALVFAMSGGAFAAKYLITSTKQIKPSVLKSLKGREGPQGLAGTNGTNGTNGKDGASVASTPEPKGANCSEGGSKFVAANGTTYACNGTNGTSSITNTEFPGAEGTCTEGGTKLVGTSTTYACNGKKGTNGKSVVSSEFSGAHAGCSEERGGSEFEVEDSGVKHYACNGSPWTAGGTLPPNKTETGTWSVLVGPTGNGLGDISFPIPLGAEIPPANVHKVLAGGSVPADCNDGDSDTPSVANPEADPGYLCVFVKGFLAGGSVKYIWNPETTSASTDTGAGTTGALLIGTSSGEDAGTGTFAVTAP